MFCAVLDEHGVSNAVLVQLSGYGTDNSANLDAMRSYPGRFKAIAVVDPDATDRSLEDLAEAGVVGVRFNLPSYDPDALMRPGAPRLLQRFKALGWFAQVYADDAQWPDAAAVLRASGVRVLVDHLRRARHLRRDRPSGISGGAGAGPRRHRDGQAFLAVPRLDGCSRASTISTRSWTSC